MPESLNRFYALSGCDEIDLDYRNFELSAAQCLAHWMGHYHENLFKAIYPDENYFGKVTSDALKAQREDPAKILDIIFTSIELQSRLSEKIAALQISGNKEDLAETFNETMKFYREVLLPKCRDICRITADHVRKNKSQYIADIMKMQDSPTLTT